MEKLFNHLANTTAKLAGRPWTFIICLAVVLLWAVTGPLFHFDQTWQLVINTGTTIVTFLMVFLIQNTQNRDAAAMHAKMDELIYAVKKADAGFIGIEHLTDKELAVILREVERRGRDIHAGQPARAVRGRPAPRLETDAKT
ncbi:MAG: low affinity iron permease family protein [Brevundimonas sp.]|jgi:low affinity Fe/Cu permease|uniref:low affinity iron permease family protein n=1 Tax=Brevundimonas TaxID=41275 RepID=UPI000EB94478|nr:low affinity iron permease family protein [Brevundimonas sp.]MCH4267638.1 low affinity iron permease family protein [Brevundimonas sp.]HAD83693.1 low affinity iron permease family protein [Brevundimonas sp.]